MHLNAALLAPLFQNLSFDVVVSDFAEDFDHSLFTPADYARATALAKVPVGGFKEG